MKIEISKKNGGERIRTPFNSGIDEASFENLFCFCFFHPDSRRENNRKTFPLFVDI